MVLSTSNRTRLLAITLALVVVGGVLFVGPSLAQEDDDGDETATPEPDDDETETPEPDDDETETPEPDDEEDEEDDEEEAADDEEEADDEDEEDDEPDSQVRLVHAVPNAPDVDVYVDGERILQNVAYGSATEYLDLEAGTHNVVLVGAEEPGGVVPSETLETEAGANYTVAATGTFDVNDTSGVQPVVLVDNATTPPEEFAAVRLAHLSPDAPEVTVTLAGTDGVVFDNVGFTESSSYLTIPEGEYSLDVRAGGADGETVQTVDVTLEGGDAQTLHAIGLVDPNATEDGEPFTVIQTDDNTGQADPTPDILPSNGEDDEADAEDETTATPNVPAENLTQTPT
jgi:hypothetical protein